MPLEYELENVQLSLGLIITGRGADILNLKNNLEMLIGQSCKLVYQRTSLGSLYITGIRPK